MKNLEARILHEKIGVHETYTKDKFKYLNVLDCINHYASVKLMLIKHGYDEDNSNLKYFNKLMARIATRYSDNPELLGHYYEQVHVALTGKKLEKQEAPVLEEKLLQLNNQILAGDIPSFEVGRQYDNKTILKDLKFAHKFLGAKVYEAKDESKNGHFFYFNPLGLLFMIKDKTEVVNTYTETLKHLSPT